MANFFIKPILTPFVTWIVNGIAPSFKVIIAVVMVAIGAALASGVFQRKEILR